MEVIRRSRAIRLSFTQLSGFCGFSSDRRQNRKYQPDVALCFKLRLAYGVPKRRLQRALKAQPGG
ncbi:hypothetical protein KCP78_18075 [Salmonella enterica subsp. enterica]|nr:hypothetical protein KCP78_18075 [Salmonella enterica subsp. enterica]